MGAKVIPRPEVAKFAELMERKLRANDWKGGWINDDPAMLLQRLREEVDELDRALMYSEINPREVDVNVNAIDEAVDVANFALMIADVVSRGR